MTEDGPDEARELGARWRLLAAGTALAMILVAVVIQATQAAVIPPLIVLAVVFVVGLGLLVSRPRAGAITIGVAAVVMVVGNLPFVVEDLAHPESFWSFLPAAIGVVGALVGVVVLVGALRRADDGAVPYVGVLAGVGVYIGNDDLVRHNFTVDDLGVDEELPSKAFVRFSFDAEPGTCEFYCDIPGHEDMTGTLTVAG